MNSFIVINNIKTPMIMIIPFIYDPPFSQEPDLFILLFDKFLICLDTFGKAPSLSLIHIWHFAVFPIQYQALLNLLTTYSVSFSFAIINITINNSKSQEKDGSKVLCDLFQSTLCYM